MSVLTVIEAKLSSDELPTLAGVGGLAAVLAEQDVLVAAPFLEVLVRLADAAVGDETKPLDSLVLRGFREGKRPLALREAVSLVVKCPELRARIAPELARVLARRVDERGTGQRALLAAYALEGMFLLALADAINRFRVLVLLAELSADEDGLFAEHAAKLAGAAFHVWRAPELLDTLERLRQHPDAEAEAAYELGLAMLSRAFEADATEEIFARLETARLYLRDAREAGGDRADAAAYHAVVEVIEGFARGTAPDDMRAPIGALEAAVTARTHLLSGASLPDWLRPRADRDVQWAELLHTTQAVARELERASWLNAGSVMARVLAVYDADRTVRAGVGLQMLLRPRIERGLAREAGLLAHLDDLLREDAAWAAEHEPLARRLRARVAERAEELTSSRKAKGDARYPLLSRVLPLDATKAAVPDAVAEQLEKGLQDWTQSGEDVANPVVQRILHSAQDEFQVCADYRGTTRCDFDELILQVVLFCKDRQDASSKQLGPRGAYLRNPDAKEADLQADLRDYLVGNYRRANILTEVDGVGKGRSDIYVSLGGRTFVIELKRHHGVVTREEARSYRGQAATYQATNVRLGMLGILELIERDGPAPTLGECVWAESYVPTGTQLARHLLVFRVPGNLLRPSDMSR